MLIGPKHAHAEMSWWWNNSTKMSLAEMSLAEMLGAEMLGSERVRIPPHWQLEKSCVTGWKFMDSHKTQSLRSDGQVVRVDIQYWPFFRFTNRPKFSKQDWLDDYIQPSNISSALVSAQVWNYHENHFHFNS